MGVHVLPQRSLAGLPILYWNIHYPEVLHIFRYLLLLLYWVILALLRTYSWLCIWRSLLAVLNGPYMMQNQISAIYVHCKFLNLYTLSSVQQNFAFLNHTKRAAIWKLLAVLRITAEQLGSNCKAPRITLCYFGSPEIELVTWCLRNSCSRLISPSLWPQQISLRFLLSDQTDF